MNKNSWGVKYKNFFFVLLVLFNAKKIYLLSTHIVFPSISTTMLRNLY